MGFRIGIGAVPVGALVDSVTGGGLFEIMGSPGKEKLVAIEVMGVNYVGVMVVVFKGVSG